MGPGGPPGPGPGPGPWGPPLLGPGPLPFFGGLYNMLGSCLSCLCCCWLIHDCFGGPPGPFGPSPFGPPPP
ncbi:hypothetical protein SOVF_018620 [Spinacia oleracea]|nr:hypothetical protein SOVF_018620 [Spinacia oleracea]